MSSTFFGLNIAKSGLYAYQAALDTTSHNISNAETEGYSRQVMGQKAAKALQVNSTYGMAGTGVGVTGVTQQRENYYDMKFWKNNTMYGEYSSKSHYMSEIENYFNEVSVDGFTTNYNSLNSSLQELQKNPSSLTVRTQVINYAKSLTQFFNTLSDNMQEIQGECNFEIRNQVDQINSKAQQIASLTKQINTLEINGGPANDLRDQRALLVDQLSEIATVSVSEKKVGDGVGVTSYEVKLDGVSLVDGSLTNKLKVVPRDSKTNMNDIDGIYDIEWENGQKFDARSQSLSGSLQGLLEVRDGNNQLNYSGETSVKKDDTSVTVTNSNIKDISQLNIPESGKIVVGNREYDYTGFEFKKDAAGNITSYTFQLKSPIVADASNAEVKIGDSINYKGIPYYMNQLNQFVRTYAKAFNDIHRTGVDLKGNPGADFFTGTSKVEGREYTFDPLKGSPDIATYDYTNYNSGTGSYYTQVPDNKPFYGSYYFVTAGNFTVNENLLKTPATMSAATDITNGAENNDIVDKLLDIKNNKLFDQGAPDAFFQTLVAEIGIDTDKANTFSDSQSNILETIKNQRLSISGVDVDEEAMNLVRYQNAYNLSAKVITVMNEIYDKLINDMGV
jgi:flagellar hook-associated protein FlgK